MAMIDCSTSERNHPSLSRSSRSARVSSAPARRRSASSAAKAARSASAASSAAPQACGRVSHTQKLPSTCPPAATTG